MELESMLSLIKAVSDSELTHFSLETEEMKLTLEKKREQASDSSIKTEVKEVVQNQERKEELKTEEKKLTEKEENNEKQQSKGEEIKSPLVGIFYRASSPEKEPFVKVGDSVKKGQVLGLIEAMKLMNEIEAEKDGIVEAILVENEQMVEYGQVLFRIL